MNDLVSEYQQYQDASAEEEGEFEEEGPTHSTRTHSPTAPTSCHGGQRSYSCRQQKLLSASNPVPVLTPLRTPATPSSRSAATKVAGASKSAGGGSSPTV